MKTNLVKFSLLTLIAAALVAVPAARAQDAGAAAATNAAPAKVKKPKSSLVFHGAAAAVDTKAMTLKVGERTFDITSKTKITKNGEPATLSDITVGEMVGGAYKKGADGKLEATSVKVGGKKKKDAEAATGK